MNLLQAVIFGALYGITEILPLSGKGFYSLSEHISGIKFGDLFQLMVNIGVIAAIILFYRRTFMRLGREFIRICTDVIHKRADYRKMGRDKNLLLSIIIGLIPLILLILPLPGVKSVRYFAYVVKSDNDIILEGFSFIFTAIMLFLSISAMRRIKTIRINKHKFSGGRMRFNPGDSLIIGFGQAVSLIFPGFSRIAVTFSLATERKINKNLAVDYSFLLFTPYLLIKIISEFFNLFHSANISTGFGLSLIGGIFAMILSFLCIKLIKSLMNSKVLTMFVGLTFIIGLVIIIIGIVEHSKGTNIFTNIPL